MRHLLTLFDLTKEEIERIFSITEDLKTKYKDGLREPLLPGRVMALLFEKPSLRTRVSFESAMTHLGGSSQFLGQDVGWGKRESVADFSKVISEFVDVIVCRTFSHSRVEELAKYCSDCNVINGLTDYSHPCQGLADLYTIRETHGLNSSTRLAYIGDPNNVSRSLAVACAKLGLNFAVSAPDGYVFDPDFLDRLKREVPEFEIEIHSDPRDAVAGAQAIYTDVWASMGQEGEQRKREADFAPYQVNAQLMAVAPKDAIFLHCLPAKRGQEVTDEVIDSKQSAVIQQAGNRMHAQKGLLAWLLAAQT
jgi:ornithine carbamoyltransferase